MDDMLNIYETCNGCGDDAVRFRMRVGIGDCCKTPGIELSEREDIVREDPAGVR